MPISTELFSINHKITLDKCYLITDIIGVRRNKNHNEGEKEMELRLRPNWNGMISIICLISSQISFFFYKNNDLALILAIWAIPYAIWSLPKLWKMSNGE